MKLSTRARYGVMAMCDLALACQKNKNKPVSLQDISKSQELSLAYLEQIFNNLKKAHLVDSVRGAMGGYILARKAETIRISDIIYALENPVQVTRCDHRSPKGCHSTGVRCLTHHLWEDMGHVIHNFLSGVTLEDVILKNTHSKNSSSDISSVKVQTSAKNQAEFFQDVLPEIQKDVLHVL